MGQVWTTLREWRCWQIISRWYRGMEQSNKDYKRAIMVLSSMQEEGIFADFENTQTKQIDMMKDCLRRIDLPMDQIDQLNIIHVAGTKGKGSTCEYTESILRGYGHKTGLFSVPHLFEVRERVRINGKPVDKETFTKTFWKVFDELHMSKVNNGGLVPGYISMTLLVALRIFVDQKVHVLVLEACTGGEYDATNFIEKPVVCGVASLGLEPWNNLGHTIEEISYHKSGIKKEGIPLVTVKHVQESVMSVILKRAKEKKSPLFTALPVEDKDMEKQLGAASGRLARNAGLAIQLCCIWRQKTEQDDVPEPLDLEYKADVNSTDAITQLENKKLTKKDKQGLRETISPGRNEVVKREKVTYYLDAAKTKKGLEQTVKWFHAEADKEGKHYRSLMFSMEETTVGQQLKFLKERGEFQRVAFCPHIISSAREEFPDSLDLTKDPAKAEETAQKQQTEWSQLQECARSACFPSIASALWWAGLKRDTTLQQRLAKKDIEQAEGPDQPADPGGNDAEYVQVLVTGSLVVVGGALSLIKPDYWEEKIEC